MIKETLQNAVNKLNQMYDEVEQLQKDNNQLTEDIKKLEDEQREGYKSFNSDSHVLIEKATLENLMEELEIAQGDAMEAASNLDNIDTYYLEQAQTDANSANDGIEKSIDMIEDLINPTEDLKEAIFGDRKKKAPAKKIVVNK